MDDYLSPSLIIPFYYPAGRGLYTHNAMPLFPIGHFVRAAIRCVRACVYLYVHARLNFGCSSADSFMDRGGSIEGVKLFKLEVTHPLSSLSFLGCK